MGNCAVCRTAPIVGSRIQEAPIVLVERSDETALLDPEHIAYDWSGSVVGVPAMWPAMHILGICFLEAFHPRKTAFGPTRVRGFCGRGGPLADVEGIAQGSPLVHLLAVLVHPRSCHPGSERLRAADRYLKFQRNGRFPKMGPKAAEKLFEAVAALVSIGGHRCKSPTFATFNHDKGEGVLGFCRSSHERPGQRISSILTAA